MKKFVIGLTGGIGSGKSTVAKIFAETGDFFVIDTDQIAKELMISQEHAISKLLQLEGQFTLKAVAAKIFSNQKSKNALEALIHPLVKNRVQQLIDRENYEQFLVESALIYESGWQDDFDLVIAVSCPVELRIKRAMRRSNLQRSELEQRIALQCNIESVHTGLLINTECDLEELRQRVLEVRIQLKDRRNLWIKTK